MLLNDVEYCEMGRYDVTYALEDDLRLCQWNVIDVIVRKWLMSLLSG